MQTAIGFLLRFYSYAFHFALGAFLLGLWYVANITGKPLNLGTLLPWEGPSLHAWVVGLGVASIASVLLCFFGIVRPLLPLWALFALVMIARGFFATSYDFGGADAFHGALWITFAALGAFLSSLAVLDRRARRF